MVLQSKMVAPFLSALVDMDVNLAIAQIVRVDIFLYKFVDI